MNVISAARATRELITRRLIAQHITSPTHKSPLDVVTALGAVQAQDYPGALWSIALRTPSATRMDVERAIAERTIIRTWPMRGTLHFVPAVDAKWMLALMAPRILKRAASRHRQLELDEPVFKRSRTLLTKALQKTPLLTRAAIFALLDNAGIATTGQRGIHILQQLCMNGVLCYGPHDEKQPTFVLFDDWIRNSRVLDTEDALRTIAERYFVGHGPATLRDFIWWTGLTVGEAKLALKLAEPSLEKLAVADREYWLARDVALPSSIPRAYLLPGFDEYMLGYTDRSAALAAEHADRIVPGGNGMFLSTMVLDGIVRGTWRRTVKPKSVQVALLPFKRLNAADRADFNGPLGRFAAYLGMEVSPIWAATPRAIRT